MSDTPVDDEPTPAPEGEPVPDGGQDAPQPPPQPFLGDAAPPTPPEGWNPPDVVWVPPVDEGPIPPEGRSVAVSASTALTGSEADDGGDASTTSSDQTGEPA